MTIFLNKVQEYKLSKIARGKWRTGYKSLQNLVSWLWTRSWEPLKTWKASMWFCYQQHSDGWVIDPYIPLMIELSGHWNFCKDLSSIEWHITRIQKNEESHKRNVISMFGGKAGEWETLLCLFAGVWKYRKVSQQYFLDFVQGNFNIDGVWPSWAADEMDVVSGVAATNLTNAQSRTPYRRHRSYWCAFAEMSDDPSISQSRVWMTKFQLGCVIIKMSKLLISKSFKVL